VSRTRIYTDEERKQRYKESSARGRAHNGYHTEYEKQYASGFKTRGSTLRWNRRLKHAARMCEISARLWLIDRGYCVEGTFSHKVNQRRYYLKRQEMGLRQERANRTTKRKAASK